MTIPLVWRTAIVVLALAGLLLAGYVVGLHTERGPALFPDFAGAIKFMAMVAAGKSLGEKLAGGGGILGAAKALFTSAKPEAPAGQP
jgi:hypothetical protein